MAPTPDEKETNPSDRTPHQDHNDVEQDIPSHVILPASDSSDEDDEDDLDTASSAHGGYMLLPQEADEEDEEGGSFQHSPLSSDWDDLALPPEPMTEVRGAGVDVTEAVAEGSVHPAFAANFPDNRIPVHLQMPKLPRTHKDDVLWNQTTPSLQRLQLDLDQVDKVKSAMAGFKLPTANIPDWAKDIPEDQWRQCLVSQLGIEGDRLTCTAYKSGDSEPDNTIGFDGRAAPLSDQGSGSKASVGGPNETSSGSPAT